MTDQVTKVLRERIISGSLKPGARIDINELSGELGVSQTPVREAILQLGALGLVTRQPYRGTVVAGIDNTRLEDITALRIDLEGRAALLGTPRLTDDGLDRMRHLQAELIAAQDSQTHTVEDFNMLNRDFHGLLYAASDSPTLLRLIGLLQSEADRIRLHFDMSKASAVAFHAEILDACERRDAQSACDATRRHLLQTYMDMRGGDAAIHGGILADVLRDTRKEITR